MDSRRYYTEGVAVLWEWRVPGSAEWISSTFLFFCNSIQLIYLNYNENSSNNNNNIQRIKIKKFNGCLQAEVYGLLYLCIGVCVCVVWDCGCALEQF